jgi:hypothetical protein
MKNCEKITASGLEPTMERMVSHHRLDVLFDAIDHHILQGQYPALEVLPLLQNPQSKKMCLIISCETTLNVDLDPFKWRPTTDTEDEPVQAEVSKKRTILA